MKEINLNNIISYLVGNYRYKLYYSRFNWLLRKHIRKQIDFRIDYMDKECLDNGECKLCGCQTTALQMANKQCDKPCYPPMVGKKAWDRFIRGWASIREKDENFVWTYYHAILSRVNLAEKYKGLSYEEFCKQYLRG